MPRNGAGTFSVMNPIVVGALRSSSAVNANFTDVGDEITNSLPTDGQAAMEGQFKAIDGTAISPGIAFADDTNTGFRRSGADEMRWVGGGSDRATLDANGKLTLANGLSVAGQILGASGKLNPQTLAGAGVPRVVLRNTSNDTNEHVMATYQSGSGTGAKGETRMIGGGSNDVATMLFYVNNVEAFRYTGTLFTHKLDVSYGGKIQADQDGFFDFPELTAAPSTPSSNVARIYCRDNGSGSTQLYYKDGAGTERNLQPPTDRQIFTASGTWTKPTQGQTIARVEVWGGGASGERRTAFTGASGTVFDAAGGGGGGGACAIKIIALSLLSNSVSVVVGAGGNSTTSSPGNPGGNSNFGSYLAAYGGEGGGEQGTEDGGGGGGLTSAAGSGGFGTGGGPRGFLDFVIWGEEVSSSGGGANPFGGAGGDDSADGGGVSLFGGGGGGEGGNANPGGNSIYGGGGGGGGNTSSISGTVGVGGTSLYGGSGGAGNVTSTGALAQDGTAPGGGGGGTEEGSSGAGARGEVRITCW